MTRYKAWQISGAEDGRAVGRGGAVGGATIEMFGELHLVLSKTTVCRDKRVTLPNNMVSIMAWVKK